MFAFRAARLNAKARFKCLIPRNFVRGFHILGIETSCDDTACALVSKPDNGTWKINENFVSSQFETHAPYSGIVPAMAAREHAHNMPTVLKSVLDSCKADLPDFSTPDVIAVTVGPGLALCLRVGVVAAKAASLAWNKPLVPVHHMEAHALMPLLSNPEVTFPFICLLVSGGHSMLVLVKAVGQYTVLAFAGSTIDDSLGETFDKVARMVRVGLHQPHPSSAVPAGTGQHAANAGVASATAQPSDAQTATKKESKSPPPPWADFAPTLSSRVPQDPPVQGHMGAALEALATEGDPMAHRFSIPLSRINRSHTRANKSKRQPSPEDVRFSFSGLKTAVLRATEAGDMTQRQQAADVAASFQRVTGVHLTQQLRKAVAQMHAAPAEFGLSEGALPKHLVVSGGAAANMYLRGELSRATAEVGIDAVFPPLSLCSDNGAMIAYAAALKLEAGFIPLQGTDAQRDVDLSSRWKLGQPQPRTLPTNKRVWGDHAAEVQAVLDDVRYAFLTSDAPAR